MLTIFHIDQNSNLREKIYSEKVNIENNTWILNDAISFLIQQMVFWKKIILESTK